MVRPEVTTIFNAITYKVPLGLGLWCLTPLSLKFHAISWWSVLLVEETRENHRPAPAQVTDKLYHIML